MNAAERWARVEPGIVLDELNAALRPHGLRFAPDISTASRATIGGMMANNSSGARSVLYGKTIDHVLEQDVVLSDGSEARFEPLDPSSGRRDLPPAIRSRPRATAKCGGSRGDHAAEIERRYPKVLRRVGGYNLDAFVDPVAPRQHDAKLIVGSEGTLGVILEAKVNLVPLPKAKAVMAIQFEDLLEALEATPAILEHQPVGRRGDGPLHPRQHEAERRARSPAPDVHRRRSRGAPVRRVLRRPRRGPAAAAGRARARLDGASVRLSLPPRDSTWRRRRRIWSLREAALGLSMAMKDDAKSLSVRRRHGGRAGAAARLHRPVSRRSSRRHGTTAGVYAHASVGCLHVRPVVNLKTEAGVRTFEAIASEIADLVLEFGGALSGEHGDGLVRSPFMEKMFGPVLYGAFRQIKRTFDPDGIFNPGKIVGRAAADGEPALRRRVSDAGARSPSSTTREYGGMGGAVEMCSGLGACRKTLDGTMCPSYMATREEKHSTRGRANVLRLAMAGRLGEAGLGDEGVREVLDLCLECRACKAECPVGVDVARFKSEFLADYWSRHGTPLRARVLGGIHEVSRWGSRLAPLSTWMAQSAPGRWMPRSGPRHRCAAHAARLGEPDVSTAVRVGVRSCVSTAKC